MARTPRTFSRRGHTEAKAGENIGQGKSREDVTEKAKQRNQQEDISELSLTRSPSRFLGVLRLFPRLRNTRFHRRGLCDGRTWREGVLSFKYRRCNETKEYHRAQQSPHENDWLPRNQNVHGRTSGDEERRAITAIVLRKASGSSRTYFPEFLRSGVANAENRNAGEDELHRTHRNVSRPSLATHVYDTAESRRRQYSRAGVPGYSSLVSFTRLIVSGDPRCVKNMV